MVGLCPHCGGSLPPTGDPFCPSCRNSLDDPPASSSRQAQQATRHAGAGAAFQVFGWLLIALAVLQALTTRISGGVLIPFFGGVALLAEAYRRYARARALTRSGTADTADKDRRSS